MPEKIPKVVIIGNGITGLTASLTIRDYLPKAHISLISDEYDYPFARTALMYIYMNDLKLIDTELHERNFYKKNRIHLLKQRALKIETAQQKIILDNQESTQYDVALIATGAQPNVPSWSGNDLKGITGFYHLQDLQFIEEKSRQGIRHAVIAGGGLIGIELAEMLVSRQIPVTFLVREKSYFSNVLPPDESAMINQEIADHKVNVLFEEEIEKILGENGHVNKVITRKGNQYSCDFLGITTGVRPVTDLATNSAIRTERGVMVNSYFETSAPHVFAAGDCAQIQLNDQNFVQQLWYSGKRQGIIAGLNMVTHLANVMGLRRAKVRLPKQSGFTFSNVSQGAMTAYDRGPYYNSAKFFSVEYQTYGNVAATSNEHNSFVQKDLKNKKLIRLVYKREESSMKFLGINLLNCRLRHEVCEKWLLAGYTVKEVLSELASADFNPEFSGKFLSDFRLACEAKLAEMSL